MDSDRFRGGGHMGWFSKIFIVLMISFLSLGICRSAAQAASLQNSELIRVAVNVVIENPEYFWKYPFLGKQLDGIRVSGMGRSFYVQPTSDGAKVEFEVPKNYKLRIGIEFQNNNSVIKEYSYSTKWGVNEKKDMLNIVLKAPQPQTAIITTSDFDEIHGR